MASSSKWSCISSSAMFNPHSASWQGEFVSELTEVNFYYFTIQIRVCLGDKERQLGTSSLKHDVTQRYEVQSVTCDNATSQLWRNNGHVLQRSVVGSDIRLSCLCTYWNKWNFTASLYINFANIFLIKKIAFLILKT